LLDAEFSERLRQLLQGRRYRCFGPNRWAFPMRVHGGLHRWWRVTFATPDAQHQRRETQKYTEWHHGILRVGFKISSRVSFPARVIVQVLDGIG
jgi:hypothetical protein